MHIPTFVVLPCFLAAFILFCWQYYVVDPINRLTDRRFLLAAISLALAIAYVPLSLNFPALTELSLLFFAAAAGLLGVSVGMTRRARRKSS